MQWLEMLDREDIANVEPMDYADGFVIPVLCLLAAGAVCGGVAVPLARVAWNRFRHASGA
jgi:hypothetical protein